LKKEKKKRKNPTVVREAIHLVAALQASSKRGRTFTAMMRDAMIRTKLS